MRAKEVYVWIPWGCYVPEVAFTGMARAERYLGINRGNIQDHFARNGFYKDDKGTMVKIDIIKNELRTNDNLKKV